LLIDKSEQTAAIFHSKQREYSEKKTNRICHADNRNLTTRCVFLLTKIFKLNNDCVSFKRHAHRLSHENAQQTNELYLYK
jgi:hypothetical protein